MTFISKIALVFFSLLFISTNCFAASNAEEFSSKIVEISKKLIIQEQKNRDFLPTQDEVIYNTLVSAQLEIAENLLGDYTGDQTRKTSFIAFLNAQKAEGDAQKYVDELKSCASNNKAIHAHLCSIFLASYYQLGGNEAATTEWSIKSAELISEIEYNSKDYWFAQFLTAEFSMVSYVYDRNIEKAIEAAELYLSAVTEQQFHFDVFDPINNLIVLFDRQHGSAASWETLKKIGIDIDTIPENNLETVLYTLGKISSNAGYYKQSLSYLEKLTPIVKHPGIEKVHFGYLALGYSKTGRIKEAQKAIKIGKNLFPEGFRSRFGILFLEAEREIASTNKNIERFVQLTVEIESVQKELNAAVVSAEHARLSKNLQITTERQQRESEALQFKAELASQKTTARNIQLMLAFVALSFLVGLLTYIFRSYRREQELNEEIQGKNDELEGVNADLSKAHNNLNNTYQQLKIAHRQAMAGQDAKQKFIGVVGHELRTPLNPIINLSSVLEDQAKDPRDRALLKAIRSAGKRLHIIVENMLAVSSADADSQVYIEKVDVVSETTTIIDEFSADMRERNQELVKSGKALRVNVYKTGDVDGMQISNKIIYRSIIRNLFDNAFKFTESGNIDIYIRPRRGRAGFLLEVSDTGQGIKPEQISKLMQPFEQAEMGLGRSHEGAGLGLAVIQKYCKQLGAKMNIDSMPGKGTKITIDFPEPAHESNTGKLLKVA